MSEADGWGGLRTVCHGCRSMREVVEQVDTHRFEVRAMIIPGDGTVYRRVRAAFESADAVVEAPCPDCCPEDAESTEDTPEWLLPGFIPPA
ncbi:MAG TPA: hypothetical protein VFV67_12060 [Actinophytocola sp.]|uniref:hypothetical protein n=1 Tax=Actinophytocola sp. TaxID=1872138 RepID=UPI002DB5D92E|nr:hypothetical protein [Actinophytocola sp.]HEU5471380.1 hypothetical protein [Actinophytocola sp.]